MSDSTEENKTDSTEASVDLSSLTALSFGPRWGDPDAKSRSGDRGERKFSPGGKGPGGKGGPRRDRRPKDFKRDSKRDFSRDKPAPFRPIVEVDFYPGDDPFVVLTKAIRASCKTYELFEIAQLILEKYDRFVAVIKPIAPKGEEKRQIYVCPIDGMPFLSEEQALNYTLKNHRDKFFDIEEVEVEAPKGSFPIVNKCGFTGELLGPPNYHRYQQLVQEHYNNQLGHMPFARFESKIESVKEEEQIQAWVEKMKKAEKYTLKEEREEGQEPKVFDTWEAARTHVMSTRKPELAKALDTARFSGKLLEAMPKNDIRRSVEQALQQQREFPLITANNLRGRMRRMKFAIYKRGAKGVSYVSAVKRKFRDSKTNIADNLLKVIEFIEKNKGCNVKNLSLKYFDIAEPAPAKEGAEAPAAAVIPEELQGKVRQLMLDLRWLVSEGYITEYGNGDLYVPPPLPEAKEKPETKAAATEPTEKVAEKSPAEEKQPEAKAEEEPPAKVEPEAEPKAEEKQPEEPEAKSEEKPQPTESA